MIPSQIYFGKLISPFYIYVAPTFFWNKLNRHNYKVSFWHFDTSIVSMYVYQ